MRNTNGRVCGTAEDRLNRFMRMMLEWQYDIRHGVPKKSSEYCEKYNIGKYANRYFNELLSKKIDRRNVKAVIKRINDERNDKHKNA
jgi:hypothetical protein